MHLIFKLFYGNVYVCEEIRSNYMPLNSIARVSVIHCNTLLKKEKRNNNRIVRSARVLSDRHIFQSTVISYAISRYEYTYWILDDAHCFFLIEMVIWVFEKCDRWFWATHTQCMCLSSFRFYFLRVIDKIYSNGTIWHIHIDMSIPITIIRSFSFIIFVFYHSVVF